MKFKTNILLNEKHKYVVMLPVQPTRHIHYLLKTTTNHLLVEPYLNIDNDNVQIGRELASILNINQNDEIEMVPFTDKISPLSTVHVKLKSLFDFWKLKNLSYINSLKTQCFEINLKDKFYKLKDTTIYTTNQTLNKVYGFSKDIINLKKMVYGSLFCKDTLSACNLPQNNVLVVKGNKKLRLNDIMHTVAHSLHANYYYNPTNISGYISENLMIVYDFDGSDIYTSINNVKAHAHRNVLFVFLVNDDEHRDKLLGYFDSTLSYEVAVPVARRDNKLILEMLEDVPYKMSDREMRNLGGLLNKRTLFEAEDVLARVVGKASFEKRVDMKVGGVFVVYSDFVEVVERFYKDEKRGMLVNAKNWIMQRFMK